MHVFDVSNLQDPDLVASVETECGSHTATAVPDPANNRLLVYNTPSSGACPGIDIIQLTSRESWCGSAPCGLAAALRSIADPQAW